MNESMKIVVADDEPNILLSLEFLMRKNGYQVFIARNGTEALEIATRERPHVVVLDIMMPDISGLDVCRQIMQQPENAHTKVIFLSAKSKEVEIQKGYEAGAVLYITKPFSTRVLMQKINELASSPPVSP